MSLLNPLHKPWGYRFLEVIPGALVWATFIFSIAISIIRPLWGVYFILAFDLYWLLRIVYLLVYMNISSMLLSGKLFSSRIFNEVSWPL